jgi:hypothetical protein
MFNKKFEIESQVTVRNRLINIPLIYKCEVVNLVFTIDSKAAKNAIKCPKLKPIELYPSRSLLFVTLFNFNETPVDPYTEITYSVPVSYNKFTIPFFSFLYQVIFNKLNFYVHTIAQSTEIAIEHGNVINGYPHYPNIIESKYIHDADNLVVNVKCQNQEVVSLNLKKPKNLKYKEESFLTYKCQNNTISSLLMETFGETGTAKLNEIKFGDHELAQTLSEMKIGSRPIDFRYYKNTTKVIHKQKFVEKL